MGNPSFNLLLNSCKSGLCSGSCDASLTGATDNNPYTAGSASLNHGNGYAWADFPFVAGPSSVQILYVRGMWPMNTSLYYLTSPGQVGANIATLNPSLNYQAMNYSGISASVYGLRLTTKTRDGVMRGFCYANVGDCTTITITEIAAQSKPCYEQLGADLGSLKIVQQIKMKYTGNTGGAILSSVDGLNFVQLASLPTGSYNAFGVFNVGNVTARYFRFRYMPHTAPVFIYLN